MENIMDKKEITDKGCIKKRKDGVYKCKHLELLQGYSPEAGHNVLVFACRSEENTCCTCCAEMEVAEGLKWQSTML